MARRQHYLFSYKKLPQLFHEHPQQIMAHVSGFGVEYGLHLWEETAQEFGLDQPDRVEPVGLKVSCKETQSYGLIIISLPLPKKSPEAFFIGLWASYSQQFAGETFRYFTLELDEFSKQTVGNTAIRYPITHFCEWAKDGEHLNYGQSAGATLEQFIEAVETCIGLSDVEPYESEFYVASGGDSTSNTGYDIVSKWAKCCRQEPRTRGLS
jgi:hypothetical protein